MNELKWRQIIPIITSLLLLLGLLYLSTTNKIPTEHIISLLLFLILIVSALVLGVRSGSGGASLAPMSAVAAFLIFGPFTAVWLLFIAAVLHGLLRYFYGDQLMSPKIVSKQELLSRTAANATILSVSMLVGSWGYYQLGGKAPLAEISPAFGPYLFLTVLFLVTNHLLAGAYLWNTDVAQFRLFRQFLFRSIIFEAVPFLFAPTLASVFLLLSQGQFAMVALGVVLISLFTFNIDLTRKRLERRVQELASLQQIGSSLSGSLELETVLQVIQAEVAKVMPLSTFFVALYDADQETIRFPLALREQEPVEWRLRKCGNGLTEYILRTKKSLLIRRDLVNFIAENNLDLIGDPAICWLGVPVIAGEEILGVISVQSLYEPDVYDEQDQALLETIAAQASLAIKNAQLYSQTNEELRRRVHELISIMRTTEDGLLLVGSNGRVLAVNEAFAAMVDQPESAIRGQYAGCPFSINPQPDHPPHGDEHIADFLQAIGYTAADAAADCQAILQGEWRRRRSYRLQNQNRYVVATMTPVLNQDEALTDWLLVVRDVSEERELNQMREDMTHMLVHDLRSPLGILLGSLQSSQEWAAMGEREALQDVLALARQGGERLLQMIDDILDIYRFETGQIPLDKQPLTSEYLLLEAKAHQQPWANEAGITISVTLEPHLPQFAADPHHVGRALQNLLDNAIKFSPDHSRIELWSRCDGGMENILLGVRDYGPGIPAEMRDRLFQKFQRFSQTGRRRGTGLGLAYCRLVAEAHGGDIWVESSGNAGEGSNFVLCLPFSLP